MPRRCCLPFIAITALIRILASDVCLKLQQPAVPVSIDGTGGNR